MLLLGETREELSGSTWADVVHDHLGGRPPVVDLAAEQALAALLREAARRGLLSAAHDLSDGGLAMALVEGCLRPRRRRPRRAATTRSSTCSASRRRERSWSWPRTVTTSSSSLAEKHGVELASIGRTGGDAFEVAGQFSVPLAELRADWEATLPAVLGPTLG